MLDNGNLLLSMILCFGGLFVLIMSFYLSLCFITWISDIIENKEWKYWF